MRLTLQTLVREVVDADAKVRSEVNTMSGRTFKIYITLVGAVCSYAVIKRFFAPDSMTLRNALIQGIFVGFGLAVVTIEVFASVKTARINGWVTAFGCGLPSNGMFTRAAHTRIFPGPINVPQEAMYWRTSVDGAATRFPETTTTSCISRRMGSRPTTHSGR